MASAGLPPFPGSSPQQSSFDPMSLMGGGQSQAPAQPNDALRSVMDQIRQIDSTIQALAGQFPEAAADARMATQALHRMLVNIVANQQAQEPASPQMLG